MNANMNSFPPAATNDSNARRYPRACQMTITPSMAQRWLEGANENNRPLALSYCHNLARDMRDGRWVLTHEGIAFSPTGRLLDGQHRLKAIVLADIPVEMFVWFDVPAQALLAINNGRRRSVVDSLTLSGQCPEINHHHISTLRALLGGLNSPPVLTPAEAAQAYDRHRDAIEFALVYLPHRGYRGVATATTRAVLARAFYTQNLDQLVAFCEVLTKGIATRQEEAPAIMLFQYLIRTTGSGSQIQADRYAKTERALAAFLSRETPTRLYGATEELFPLPEEK